MVKLQVGEYRRGGDTFESIFEIARRKDLHHGNQSVSLCGYVEVLPSGIKAAGDTRIVYSERRNTNSQWRTGILRIEKGSSIPSCFVISMRGEEVVMRPSRHRADYVGVYADSYVLVQ